MVIENVQIYENSKMGLLTLLIIFWLQNINCLFFKPPHTQNDKIVWPYEWVRLFQAEVWEVWEMEAGKKNLWSYICERSVFIPFNIFLNWNSFIMNRQKVENDQGNLQLHVKSLECCMIIFHSVFSAFSAKLTAMY